MAVELFVYDIETYPNLFSIDLIRDSDGAHWYFEISDFQNDINDLSKLLYHLRVSQARMVGFKNVEFDYPVLHYLMNHPCADVPASDLYAKAQAIIDTPWGGPNKWAHRVWDSDILIPQVDLYLIHHFDNKSRRTRLKDLQFAMGLRSIEDLPYPPGTVLTQEQAAVVKEYNHHDVVATRKFLHLSREQLEFRDQLSKNHGIDFTNFNDTKIGKQYLIMELERQGVQCYERDAQGRRTPRQTRRDSVNLGELIFPYIHFTDHEFNRVKGWLTQQTVTETKGVFTDLSCNYRGVEYTFGLGGIHASVNNEVIVADETTAIIDLDVTSYYPSVAIANSLYPQHLSRTFTDIYSSIKKMRVQHPKGSAENAMLKLALNGVYGDSNNQYSPFYDPAYMLTTTVNGQLMLCMLSEWLSESVPTARIIQVNTDGVTVAVDRRYVNQMRAVAAGWESLTGLDLEEAEYSRMWIRDVNNYLAEKTDGSIKRRGAYRIGDDLGWHQDMSAMVVPYAVEQHLVHGRDPREVIQYHTDPLDFMIRAKVRRSDRLELVGGPQLQRTSRFYVSTDGKPLQKVLPPLARSPEKTRPISICSGYLVTECNNIESFRSDTIDYGYYFAEAKKLLKPFKRC